MSTATAEMPEYHALFASVAEIIPAAESHRRLGLNSHEQSRSIWGRADRCQRRRFVSLARRVMGSDWLPSLAPYWRFRLFMEVVAWGRAKERARAFAVASPASLLDLVHDPRLWDEVAVAQCSRSGRVARGRIGVLIDADMGVGWHPRMKRGKRFRLFCGFIAGREHRRRMGEANAAAPHPALMIA